MTNIPPNYYHFPPGFDSTKQRLGTWRIAFQFLRGILPPIKQLFATYGDTFYVRVANRPMTFFFTKPEDLREILITNAKHIHKDDDYTHPQTGLARFLGTGLLTSEGEFWKRQRKLMSPAFHAQRVSAYADTMVRYSEELMNTWRDDEMRNMAHDMMNLTMNIIAYTLFTSTNADDRKRVGQAVNVMQNMFSDGGMFPLWFPTRARIRAKRAERDLDEIVYGIIAERRADLHDTGDLLSMLLLTEGDNGERMTDKEVRDEIATLYLAGHETTANTLNWTFYLLSEHPDIEKRMHDELDSVLAGRTPTLADLPRLRYTEQVIKEALRLYPPAWIFSREAMVDLKIGGYDVPAGSILEIVTYFVHRNPEVWANPLEFDPDRFSEANAEKIDKWAYIPFGGGQRVCIGQSFAMLEAHLILATIASRYQLRLKAGHVVKPFASITLNPKGGLPMTIHKR
jgi:cytochrome P450